MATDGFVPAALTSRPWVNVDQWTDQLKRSEPEHVIVIYVGTAA